MMQLLIILFCIFLLVLVAKFKVLLQPAGIFTLIWIVFIATSVLFFDGFLYFRYNGLIFILLAVLSFLLGYVVLDEKTASSASVKTIIFCEKRALFVMLLSFAISFCYPISLLIEHGYSFSDFFDIGKLLKMNNEMATERYSGEPTNTPFYVKLLLPIFYFTPLFGGFCFRLLSKNIFKSLSVFTLLPPLVVLAIQNTKMGIMTCLILWLSGFLISSFTFRLTLKVTPKIMLCVILGFFGFLAVLFASMVLRTGQLDSNIVYLIKDKFVVYALGGLPCFDLWFESSAPIDYDFGAKTFYGISNMLGILTREHGLYPIPLEISVKGGITNIYTLFRVMIEDFGRLGTCLVLMMMGFVAKFCYLGIRNRYHVCLSQIGLIFFYAFVMWSFITTFWAYTSYFVMLAAAYVAFKYVQKES